MCWNPSWRAAHEKNSWACLQPLKLFNTLSTVSGVRFWERVSNSKVFRRDGCFEKSLESSKAALWGVGGGGGLIEGWVFV